MATSTSPYVVFRRCRLPVSELAGLEFRGTWEHVERWEDLRTQLAATAARLADDVAEQVAAAPASARPGLVELRRDLHNLRHRRALDRLDRARPHLDPATVRAVAAWCALGERVDAVARAVPAQLEADTAAARDTLRRVFEHDAVERSVQLSGAQLYRDLRALVDGTTGHLKPSRVRVRESSLVNFAYRACLKPSPFGRFAEVGAFDPADPTGAPVAPAGTSVTGLNRLLVNWVLAALPRIEGGLELGVMVLSSALRTADDLVELAGTLPGGRQDGQMPREGLLRIGRDPRLLAAIDVLRDGPAPARQVLAAVTDATGDADAARGLLLGLLRAGVLFHRPAADDHDPRYGEAVAAMLDEGTSPGLVAVREQVAALRRLEDGFADADADAREALLGAARAAVDTVAAVAGVAPPPDEVLRSAVFEDTPAAAPPQAWDRRTVEQATPALRSLWRLASALDVAQVRRLGLRDFARTVLGGRPTAPFLDLFDAFSALDDAAQARVLLGLDSPDALALARRRDAALRDVREAVKREGDVARLESGAIDAALDTVDGLTVTESVTFRLQFAGGVAPGSSSSLVVNGVLTGYGVYMSRFGTFVPGSARWSLPQALRHHLARRFPDQVDLNSVLGFNFNLHPPVTPRVVDYPGAVSLGRPTLRPADLHVRVDDTAVHLCDPRTGRDVDLVPLNFMTPYGVPLLYRLLEALTPSNRYQWNLWADVVGDEGPDGSTPRLLVDDVVAERRSWTFPAGDLPMLERLSRDDVTALVELDAWRRAHDVPRHVYVLCQTPAERDVMAGRGDRTTRRWSDFTHLRRARVHKPMYVDLRNPFLVRSLAKSALSRPGVHLQVRECLPAVDDYAPGTGRTAAEEYVVELCTDR